MELLKQFCRYSRLFANSPLVPTSSQKLQENHAEKVEHWLELTSSLMYMSSKERRVAEDILEEALKSSRLLFMLGDEISAWVGQQRIANVAEQILPGKVAAEHLATSARFALYQYLLTESEETLERMRSLIKETDHPFAAQYWEMKGMILSFRKRWTEAVPYFQLAREHIELSSKTEIRHILRSTREDMISHQELRIVDGLTCQGWLMEGPDRKNLINQARLYLNHAKGTQLSPTLRYLTNLNEAELHLLEGKLDDARTLIQSLLDTHNIESRKTSVLHPGAFVMKARLADIEGDQTAMISYLSRALSESTLMFPDVMQELQVVDYALDMISRNAMNRNQWKPLLEAMVLMLEAKDWYTGRDHSRSVARTAVRLYRHWKGDVDKAMLEDLYWAAYLHDIGKLRLPRSLLNKIAPLGKDEWTVIRRHPTYTRAMLEALGAHQMAEWAEQHHQDLHGNGYPGNKPASEPGLCIAIADIVEAATSSDRKYSKPLTLEQILHELRNSRYRKYPPVLLDLAERILS